MWNRRNIYLVAFLFLAIIGILLTDFNWTVRTLEEFNSYELQRLKFGSNEVWLSLFVILFIVVFSILQPLNIQYLVRLSNKSRIMWKEIRAVFTTAFIFVSIFVVFYLVRLLFLTGSSGEYWTVMLVIVIQLLFNGFWLFFSGLSLLLLTTFGIDRLIAGFVTWCVYFALFRINAIADLLSKSYFTTPNFLREFSYNNQIIFPLDFAAQWGVFLLGVALVLQYRSRYLQWV